MLSRFSQWEQMCIGLKFYTAVLRNLKGVFGTFRTFKVCCRYWHNDRIRSVRSRVDRVKPVQIHVPALFGHICAQFESCRATLIHQRPPMHVPHPSLTIALMIQLLQGVTPALLLSTIGKPPNSSVFLFAQNCHLAAYDSRLQDALGHSLLQR